MNEIKLNILVIDDDPIIRNLLRSILKEKVNVFTVETPSLAFKILKTESIDIVITDFRLPEMDGLKVLELVKEEDPHIEVIMISSGGDMNTVIEAMRKGAIDFFRKPFTANDIWLSIERTHKFKLISTDLTKAKRKNNVLQNHINHSLDAIIGNSESIKNIKEQIELVANTPDTSVLILGESGTGKELVARGIHNLSSRNEELFGAVNMSAIPESLFESEFFGHKKGSFTGAIGDKAGWFESANGGTLFFDEIGEMSIPLQVKLLRVLEDRKYIKVGNQREQIFDIRIIAATNKTVSQLMDGKSFRLDLFHRLSTFLIEVPPLRERKEDLPLITEYFVKMFSKKINRPVPNIHPGVYELFNKYSFPGNIRELKNLIERAVIICTNHELSPSHFRSLEVAGAHNPLDENSLVFDLKELEKRTIVKALQKVNFNKAEAARLLNLEWNALYRRIQKFDIDFPE
jgi:DNA-binding NtrC family response regulator